MRLKKLFYMILLIQALVFCMLTGCNKNEQASMRNNMDSIPVKNTPSRQYSWLALGDSYTIGQSVNADERFPAQTISLLENDSMYFYEPYYIAATGWTTQDLLDAIAQHNPPDTFDIVSLLIGVNDQYQRRDTTGYRENFKICLQKAIALAGNNIKHVFVVSIPDYSVTPFAANDDTALLRKQIEAFNEINKEVTLSYNIGYISITDLTREAKTDNTLIADDGLHPSGKEYAKWAALLATSIKKVLK